MHKLLNGIDADIKSEIGSSIGGGGVWAYSFRLCV
jgi:hypothetical protein